MDNYEHQTSEMIHKRIYHQIAHQQPIKMQLTCKSVMLTRPGTQLRDADGRPLAGVYLNCYFTCRTSDKSARDPAVEVIDSRVITGFTADIGAVM